MIGNLKAKIALICLLLGLSCYAMRVSDEDVKACVEATGWNKDRCQVELSR